MNLSRLTRFLILVGLCFSVYVCYALVMMNDRSLAWWNFSYGALFSACFVCARGLWCSQSWGLWLSLILALACLGLGLYFVHFAWTFWIFKQPTFFERVVAVLNPRILVFVSLPAAWLCYFSRPAIRAQF